MGVKIGSARVDENGKAHGGQAGDQTGKEVSTQSWYRHAKGWRVLRPISHQFAEKSADAMEAACKNSMIGYDQYQRDTLLKASEPLFPKYYPGAVKVPCETDCSALIRVCVAYAAGEDAIGRVLNGQGFSTANQVSIMLKTGNYLEMTGNKYTESSDYLERGDVLVTRSKGHTVMVLENGPKAIMHTTTINGVLVRCELTAGRKGADVKYLQGCLIDLGYDLPKYGADGDFGDETKAAVEAFQKDNSLSPTGKITLDCWKAIQNSLNKRIDLSLKKISRNLKKGCVGYDVISLQEGLIKLDYSLPKYGADGDFGDETKAAVEAFQKDNNLEVDGIFGPISLNKMIEVLCK